MITTDKIAKYWDKQAEIWAEEKQDAWNTAETDCWIAYFKELLPTLSGNKVLEVGTASGYFANIMTLAGFEVTAVDFSGAMIAEAKRISKELGTDVVYHVMDAQKLDFPVDTFDLIFTRLMTWSLPDTHLFYQSSFNVLKEGGTLLNFDGDFGEILFSQDGHERYPSSIMEEANTIKAQLAISQLKRPEADINMLEEIGYHDIQFDLYSQNRILKLEQEEASLFEVKAIKPFKG